MVNSSYFNRSTTNIIKYPVITDKATRLLDNNQYSFVVNPYSDKITIKAAIEYLFNVKVTKVNTLKMHGKWKRLRYQAGRTSDWKKAVVTLKEGDKIDIAAT